MKVYISHSALDGNAARQLALALRNQGYDVGRARSEGRADAAPRASSALRSAGAMVVLLSPEAVVAPRFLTEINYAIMRLRFRGRLIPVMLRETRGFPWILRKLDIVPFDLGTITERLRHPQFPPPHSSRAA